VGPAGTGDTKVMSRKRIVDEEMVGGLPYWPGPTVLRMISNSWPTATVRLRPGDPLTAKGSSPHAASKTAMKTDLRRRCDLCLAKIRIGNTPRQPQKIRADDSINHKTPDGVPTGDAGVCDELTMHQVVQPVEQPQYTDHYC